MNWKHVWQYCQKFNKSVDKFIKVIDDLTYLRKHFDNFGLNLNLFTKT